MKIKTSELEGVALDWAVAVATEVWKKPYMLHPDALETPFCGIDVRMYPLGQHGEPVMACVLMPNNPFRQDPHPYCPSTNWAQTGPLIERYQLRFMRDDSKYMASCREKKSAELGKTHLIAACRAIVAAELGSEVDVPDEVVE